MEKISKWSAYAYFVFAIIIGVLLIGEAFQLIPNAGVFEEDLMFFVLIPVLFLFNALAYSTPFRIRIIPLVIVYTIFVIYIFIQPSFLSAGSTLGTVYLVTLVAVFLAYILAITSLIAKQIVTSYQKSKHGSELFK